MIILLTWDHKVGGNNGGQIVASGRVMDLIKDPHSLTTQYLADYCGKFDMFKDNN